MDTGKDDWEQVPVVVHINGFSEEDLFRLSGVMGEEIMKRPYHAVRIIGLLLFGLGGYWAARSFAPAFNAD